MVSAYARGRWPSFISVLLPVAPGHDPAPDVAGLEVQRVGGDTEDGAGLVHLPEADGWTTVGCPHGRRGGSIEYTHDVRTDADLVLISERPGMVEVSALHATVVEHDGETLADVAEPADFHFTVDSRGTTGEFEK
jgi:hypothetical protein